MNRPMVPPEMPPRLLRLLIVDDSPNVRRDLAQLLSLAGDLQVAGEASDGVSALRQADRLHPDVVLLDLEMPVMDGYAAARQLKDRWPDCRVIALSVHGYPAARQRAGQAGCDAFIEKGTPYGEILDTIRRM